MTGVRSDDASATARTGVRVQRDHAASGKRSLPDVIGAEDLVAKHSAVDSGGNLHVSPVEGVIFRPTRPIAHEDGHVTEVARAGWEILGAPLTQVHITTTFAGRIRAWGLHQHSADRLFVVSGLVRIVVFDGRGGSPTIGRVNEFVIGERNPALLVIPPNVYHGWKNIGTTEAIIINMPERPYHYEEPDALDLPWDSEAARRIVPYTW
ncbi:MAG: dTDP-4-dehydrorhamnose 3,5-epimerase family protein [Steroidobacterales bacterium]